MLCHETEDVILATLVSSSKMRLLVYTKYLICGYDPKNIAF